MSVEHPSLQIHKEMPKQESLPDVEVQDFTEQLTDLKLRIGRIKEIQTRNAEEIARLIEQLDELESLEKRALELLIKRLQK